MEIQKPKKKTSKVAIIFLLFLFLYACGQIFRNEKSETSPSASSTPLPPKPKTDAEIKAEKEQAKLIAKFGNKPEQSQWDGSYREIKRFLKKAANDPDSIDIGGCTKVSIDKKEGWIIGCEFRGKNAFGGLVKNANWFVIRNGTVVKMLPGDAYK